VRRAVGSDAAPRAESVLDSSLPEVAVAVARPAAWVGRRRTFRLRKNSIRLLLFAALMVVVLINDLPLLWMGITSIKPDREIVVYPPTGLPIHPTFDNYVRLFTISEFGHYLFASALVATVSTIGVVVLGTLGAYAVVRFKFPFVRWMGEASLAAYMVPSILLLVPLIQIMYGLHLDNNLISLMLIYTTLLLPFGLWTLRSYFQGISVELEHAAMVDGCTRFGAFIRVVVPQAIPGMIASAIFTFNAAWGEYMFASTLITNPDSLTLSPGLLLLMPSHGIQQWGMMMAASIVMTLPLLVLFILFQRQLVETWGEGAVKG
jgi:ABC-type glycerol-3-phosphate transport system permease component